MACGQNEMATLMEEALAGEKKADTLLNDVANRFVNRCAIRQAA